MMIAARNAFLMGGAKPWQNPYITDGLVAMWDGEWNAGGGVHDATATTWANLAPNGLADLQLSGGYTINANSITFDGVSGQALGQKLSNAGYLGMQIEVVTHPGAAHNGAAAGWTLAGGSSRRPCVYINGYSNFFGMMTGSSTSTYVPLNGFYLVALSAGGSGGAAALYVNGAQAATYSDGAQDFSTTANNFRVGSFGNTSNGVAEYKNETTYIVRIYSRALTAAEVAANYAIDAARFGL